MLITDGHHQEKQTALGDQHQTVGGCPHLLQTRQAGGGVEWSGERHQGDRGQRRQAEGGDAGREIGVLLLRRLAEQRGNDHERQREQSAQPDAVGQQVEQVNWLKQWRGLATRYAKRAVNYRAMVVIASIVIWLES